MLEAENISDPRKMWNAPLTYVQSANGRTGLERAEQMSLGTHENCPVGSRLGLGLGHRSKAGAEDIDLEDNKEVMQ